MCHLCLNGKPEIDYFKYSSFAELKMTIDAEMKRLKVSGESSKRKQAEPISVEEEERLWQMGLLRDHNPQALVDTILFYNGLYFALRSGGEHRQLRREPCQIQMFEPPGEVPYLGYTEVYIKEQTRRY